jgi:hypothetical protein
MDGHVNLLFGIPMYYVAVKSVGRLSIKSEYADIPEDK